MNWYQAIFHYPSLPLEPPKSFEPQLILRLAQLENEVVKLAQRIYILEAILAKDGQI